jgi:hypothetical protein
MPYYIFCDVFTIPKQKGDKNFFKKSVFPVCWLISASFNEHALNVQETQKQIILSMKLYLG